MALSMLQRAGIAGLVWGVLLVILYSSRFVFAGNAATWNTWIVDALVVLAMIAFIAMVYFLGSVLKREAGRFAAYAGMGLALLLMVSQLFHIGGATAQRILSVLFGISIVAIGVMALLQDESGAWRAFAILLIIAGASKAIVGDIVYPLVACAAGVVLFVATKSAAKRAA